MITNKQKKEFVEMGLNEFEINPKFRKFIIWLITEFDKTYDKIIDNEKIKFLNKLDKGIDTHKLIMGFEHE